MEGVMREEMDAVEKIAAAVLYEGYVLWPYRRSARKNQKRWTFGGVYPRAWSDSSGTGDPWVMQTQCLVTGEAPVVAVRVRFLQVVERQVYRIAPDGSRVPVDDLMIDGTRYLSWEEALEREVRLDAMNLSRAAPALDASFLGKAAQGESRDNLTLRSAGLEEIVGECGSEIAECTPERFTESRAGAGLPGLGARPHPRQRGTPQVKESVRFQSLGEVAPDFAHGIPERPAPDGPLLQPLAEIAIHIPAGFTEEPIAGLDGRTGGAIVRLWEALEGTIHVGAERLADNLHRLTVRISNTTPWNGGTREETLRKTLVSTHIVLTVKDGEFVSLTDPPDALKSAAEGCANRHTWPVLMGEAGETQTMLSSPIILPDYPQVAPESPGDLFDGGEIDQLLLLNILTLTDEEKEEMRASDPRTREILERSEALTTDDFMRLHGAIREFRVLGEEDPFAVLERPAPESVTVAGREVRKGSRVRLRPHGRDLMDSVLGGRFAIVEGIEQDYEERVHLAVTVEDDPGRELGVAGMMGHRFFFAPEEVEPAE